MYLIWVQFLVYLSTIIIVLLEIVLFTSVYEFGLKIRNSLHKILKDGILKNSGAGAQTGTVRVRVIFPSIEDGNVTGTGSFQNVVRKRNGMRNALKFQCGDVTGTETSKIGMTGTVHTPDYGKTHF